MTYLHQHAGYTRVHNPLTGKKDLQRLPGLVAIAYQHETSRCGDPHLHTHVIVPNRQARADGALVSIDSKSLYHEAKAAGIDLSGRAAPRAARRARRGMERGGRAHRDGRDRRRHQGLRQGVVAALDAAAGMGAQQPGRRRRCSRARSSWRPRRKPPGRPNRNPSRGPSSKSSGAPMRAVCSWTAPRILRRAPRGAPRRACCWTARALARMVAQHRQARVHARRPRRAGRARCCRSTRPGIRARSSKRSSTWSGCAISAPRDAHHREGHELFTVDAVIAEEARIFEHGRRGR